MSITLLNSFNPTAEREGQLQTNLTGPCGVLYLLNESLETLIIKADDGRLFAILPALWALPIVINNPPPMVIWVVMSTQNAEDTTLQQVQGAAYTADEDTSKLYSGPLPRIANVGNPASVSSTTTVTSQNNSLTATGASAGQTFISSTLSGQSNPSISITYDGLVQLSVLIASALVEVLQTLEPGATGNDIIKIGAANYIAHVLGNFLVDGTATFSNAVAINAASTLGDAANHEGATVNGPLTVQNGTTQSKIGDSTNKQGLAVQGPLAVSNGAATLGDTSGKQGATVNGPLGVTGASTLSGALAVNAASTLGDTTNKEGATVNGALTVTGTINATGGVINNSGGTVAIQDAGTTVATFSTASGAGLDLSTLTGTSNDLKWVDGAKQSSIHGFSGSNSTSGVTVNHNCNKIPQSIWVCINSGSSAGSATTGIGNLTATTCLVTSGAVLSGFYGSATTYN